jgi:DNA polymerase II large subunit
MEAMKNSKRAEKKVLETFEGVICDGCNMSFRRPPMIGKCDSCGGQLSFYSGEDRSKTAAF